ncbi:coiled-coil domain-containing protein 39-like [Oscarella lobularis]|uniref:coiled-coil domain-containing protein 39-like n=1 Tax=Oscarella lobularis TaxID=121494 RepID=UPI003313A8B8
MADFVVDEATVPVANEENKRLQAEVQRKQKDIASLEAQIEEHNERIQSLSDHMKNIRQEQQHSQALLDARKKELGTEEHFKLLAERETGRLGIEMRKIESDIRELREQLNGYENSKFRLGQKIEGLKGQMKWDQQTLDEWIEEAERRDEDARVLMKYTSVDDSKLKELGLQLERLTDKMKEKRSLLDKASTDTLTAQIELDRTAELFRQTHRDRESMIEQWEETIGQMKKRDSEIDHAANDLTSLKVEVQQMESGLRDKESFLESEMANNQEQDKRIGLTERQLARMRLDYQDAETSRMQFHDELETLKYSVERTNTDLMSKRAESQHLKKELSEKAKRMELLDEERLKTQETLKETINLTLTAEEHSQRMEELLDHERSRLASMETALQRLRDVEFKKAQDLFELKQKEANSQGEVQGNQAAIRNLNSKLNKVDQESLKQQELIYSQDFQLQQLERKILRLQGERSTEEKEALNAKIKDLTVQNEQQQATETLLQNQLKRLGDDLRRATRDLEKSRKEKSDLTGKIEELELHNDSSRREMKKVMAKKQDLMVDKNILQLEVKRLRQELNSKADEVLSLEKRKLQLHTAMAERTHEIDMHKDMLKAQIRAQESEKQKMNVEVFERFSKIDKLRKRYEILVVSMAPPEGDEDHSQAYYVIKAAQEREELQRKGDELDARIRQAEKEIRALENTLRLMNGKNESYRKSFNKVDQTSAEYEDKQRLEEQHRALLDKYRYKRRQIKELQEDLQAMNRTLSSLDQDEKQLELLVEEREQMITQLKKEIDEQESKRDRVSKLSAKVTRDLRSRPPSASGGPKPEDDVALRTQKELIASLMQQLGQVSANVPDLASSINLLCSQAGLPPPPTPTASGRAGSRPTSARTRSQVSVASSPSAASVRTLEMTVTPTRGVPPPARQGGKSSASSRSSSVASRTSSRASGTSSRRGLIPT